MTIELKIARRTSFLSKGGAICSDASTVAHPRGRKNSAGRLGSVPDRELPFLSLFTNILLSFTLATSGAVCALALLSWLLLGRIN